MPRISKPKTSSASSAWAETFRQLVRASYGPGWILREHRGGRTQISKAWPDGSRSSVTVVHPWRADSCPSLLVLERVCKVGNLPQPDHCCCQRHDGQVMARELLVAGGHPAELFDPGKEALHLIALPVGRFIKETPPPVIPRPGNYATDSSLPQQLTVRAGEVSRIGHDLASSASGNGLVPENHQHALGNRC